MSTRDVLVVDDDTTSLLFFRLLLESEGFDVATVSEGGKALEMLENNDYGMVITDLNMPRISGLELAVKVREQYPEIDVVLVTAGDPSDISGDATEAGISRIFSKPVNSKTFVTTIRSSLCPEGDKVGSTRERQP